MSAGAVFKLIANDGKADRMIMATKLLNQRIKDVMCARKRAGKADITPTLVDLERTHILYVNAHFKPFAAIGYEYNKVRPQSGTVTLGSGVQFSIPQFGDFFHDMVCRTRLSQVMSSTLLTPAQALGSLTNPVPFPFNGTDSFGRFAIAFPGSQTIPGLPPGASVAYNLVDVCGNILVQGVPYNIAPPPTVGQTGAAPANFIPVTQVCYRNLVRYCEYPGNRLFSRVKFDVNGNPLDEYNDVVSIMLQKFTVTPNKEVGYNRLVGQEVPREGYGPINCCPVFDANAANTPAGISAVEATQAIPIGSLFPAGPQVPNNSCAPNPTGTQPPLAAFAAAPTGVYGQMAPQIYALNQLSPSSPAQGAPATLLPLDYNRQKLQFVDGPQTPKPIQPPVEIWNKLRFWFNDDVRLSIASVSIPFGQRFITIDLAPQSYLVFEFPGLFLETVIDVPGFVVNAGGTQALPLGTVTQCAQRIKSYTPIFQQGNIGELNIERMELYVNNIFVNPEIHDIFIKRIGFSLIRVYRFHIQRVNQSGTDEKLLSQLKWPIEYMMVGLRPTWNITNVTASGGYITGGNVNVWRDWHRLTKMVDVDCDQRQLAEMSQFAFSANFCNAACAPFTTVAVPTGSASAANPSSTTVAANPTSVTSVISNPPGFGFSVSGAPESLAVCIAGAPACSVALPGTSPMTAAGAPAGVSPVPSASVVNPANGLTVVTPAAPITVTTAATTSPAISANTALTPTLIGLSNGINVNAAAQTASSAQSGVGGGATVIDSSVAWACSNIGEVVHTSFAIPVHTVDTLTLTAHGITIYDTFNDEFFNAYMPFHYGGPALVTPYDEGALFVNFALFPRSYQPSGHLNISRARETYLRWTTSYISSNTPADLLCVAIAINFLLITDGSAVLRYST